MAATLNYNRPKSTLINVTPIDLTLLVGEKPDAPTAIGGTGTTAALDCRIQADADESVGADVQDLFKIEVTPTITSDGKATCTVVVTPIGGGGGSLTAETLAVLHPETVDAWQAAAGRARQP